jgi:hypothetical protein
MIEEVMTDQYIFIPHLESAKGEPLSEEIE